MIFATAPSELVQIGAVRPSVKNLQESGQEGLLFSFSLCMISVLFSSRRVVVYL